MSFINTVKYEQKTELHYRDQEYETVERTQIATRDGHDKVLVKSN